MAKKLDLTREDIEFDFNQDVSMDIINKSSKRDNCQIYDHIKKSIMVHSLSRLLSDKKYKLKMEDYETNTSKVVETEFDVAPLPNSNKYFQTSFDKIYNYCKNVGYISTICKNPEDFYPEFLPKYTYYDVHDYFREAITCITKDNKIVNGETNKNDIEQFCSAGDYCWANRRREKGGGGYGIILRKFKKYEFCICCIREVVYKKYMNNCGNFNTSTSQNNLSYTCIQPHFYTVDNVGVVKNNKLYRNYSSEYMVTRQPNSSFLGLVGPFPKHTTDRYKPQKVKL